MFPIEVAAELAFGERGGRLALPVIVQRQPGGEVRLDETVEERALGAPAVIAGPAPGRASRRAWAWVSGSGDNANEDATRMPHAVRPNL